jgi:hypothetical protein
MEFKVSIGFKILVGFAGLIVLFALAQLLKTPSTGRIIDAILIMVVYAIIVFNQFKRKITITENAFIYNSIFRKEVILLSTIRGYRFADKGFRLYYGEQYIDSKFIRDDYESDLIEWRNQNLVNLDQQDREQEYQEILQSEHIAVKINPDKPKVDIDKSTQVYNEIENEAEPFIENAVVLNEEQLDEQFEKCFKITLVYDVIAAISLLFNLVSPNWVLMICLIIYPIIGLIIIARSNSLIRLCYKQTSPRYSLFIGIVLCCAMLLLTRITNEQPFLFTYFTVLGLTVSIAFIGVAYFVDTAEKTEPYNLRRLWLLILGVAYGFGAVVQTEFIWGHFIK